LGYHANPDGEQGAERKPEMRTIMQYNGKPHPVMNCHFTANIHPPLPDKDAPDFWDKYREWEKEPRLLIELEIVFPRYYWRAKYIQEGKSPLWIGDSPMTGNAVQLKDCTFENLVDLRLPNGDTLRGFPEKGMPADVIREHTAILEQERLLPRENVAGATEKRGKLGRKTKDPRPLPPPDVRGEYTNKIWDLIPTEHSNRKLAKQVIAWAHERGEKDPNGFARWKIIGESALQKEAGSLRKDWAKERAKAKAKRRNR